MFICLLKQSLSFQEIKTALSLRPTEEEQKETYQHLAKMVNDYRDTFVKANEERMGRIRAEVGEDAPEEEIALLYITLTSLEATADKLLCSKILKDLQDKETKKANTTHKERKKATPSD